MLCPRCLAQYPADTSTCAVDGQALVPESELLPHGPDLAPGTPVGEYVIEAKLGEGGFGSVYRAVHPIIGKAAAVKVLNAHYSSKPQMVARFIAEARAANQVRHPNIVDIFAFGKLEDGRRFYVMELLEGTPLDRYLRQSGPVPPSIALPLLRGVADALDAAHAAGVVHRDLKPENVFVAFREGGLLSVKLLDFGIAKLVDDTRGGDVKTRTGTPLGTPHYMSPEQCRAKGVDQRTDVYSFGVMIHRVLTGHLPFDMEDPLDLLNAQVSAPPPRMSSVLPSLPPEMDAPVLHMLEKSASRRPDTAGAALKELIAAASTAGLDIGMVTPDIATLIIAGGGSKLGSFTTGENAEVSTMPDLTAPAQSVRRRARNAEEAEAPAAVASKGKRRARRTARLIGSVAAVGVLGALIASGVHLRGKGTVDPASPLGARTLTPSAHAAEAASATPLESPVPVVAPAPAPEVTVTITDAPPGTKVFVGEALIGAAPGPIRLAHGEAPVTLRFVAEGHTSAEMSVTPDRDRLLAVSLQHTAGKPAPPPKPKTSRDLEPF